MVADHVTVKLVMQLNICATQVGRFVRCDLMAHGAKSATTLCRASCTGTGADAAPRNQLTQCRHLAAQHAAGEPRLPPYSARSGWEVERPAMSPFEMPL